MKVTLLAFLFLSVYSYEYDMLFAGFGGQGLLFSGKFLAYSGLIDNREISWIPSYGPEQRGGTCNCGVVISDKPVACPVVTYPTLLMVMNRPSLDKFENNVKPGGKIFLDSSMIERKVKRTDIDVFYIPATKIAHENDMGKMGNMILVGAILEDTKMFKDDLIEKSLRKLIGKKKAKMFDKNFKAIQIGREYYKQNYGKKN